MQDELARESISDIPTVVLSYAIMFLYVSFSLGRFLPIGDLFFVHTRFLLGLGGVTMVILSLIISVGLGSLFGVKATLIISEVIPFLVLAIGVDNVFILVNHFDRTDKSLSTEERMGKTLQKVPPSSFLFFFSFLFPFLFCLLLKKVGSSIAVASVAEALAFLLGALTRMPAVQAFSYYASLAIFFDFLLQITCFVALLALDTRRVKVIQLKHRATHSLTHHHSLTHSLTHSFYIFT